MSKLGETGETVCAGYEDSSSPQLGGICCQEFGRLERLLQGRGTGELRLELSRKAFADQLRTHLHDNHHMPGHDTKCRYVMCLPM